MNPIDRIIYERLNGVRRARFDSDRLGFMRSELHAKITAMSDVDVESAYRDAMLVEQCDIDGLDETEPASVRFTEADVDTILDAAERRRSQS